MCVTVTFVHPIWNLGLQLPNLLLFSFFFFFFLFHNKTSENRPQNIPENNNMIIKDLDYNITSVRRLVTNKGHSKTWSFIWKKDIYYLLNYWLQMTWCSPTQRSAICPGHCKPWFLWEKILRGHWSRICPLKSVISRNCRSRPWWEPEADSLLRVCEVILARANQQL